MRELRKKMLDRRGRNLVEYVLILALVPIVVMTALTVPGGKASDCDERSGERAPLGAIRASALRERLRRPGSPARAENGGDYQGLRGTWNGALQVV